MPFSLLYVIGVPFHPDASRYWQIVDQFKVSKFYTAPTALRTLMKFDEKFLKCTDRSSLKILGSPMQEYNTVLYSIPTVLVFFLGHCHSLSITTERS